jgi:hypothetical protein
MDALQAADFAIPAQQDAHAELFVDSHVTSDFLVLGKKGCGVCGQVSGVGLINEPHGLAQS